MSRYSSHALHESDEPTALDVVPLPAYREKRRQDEINAFNFGTRHKPGELDVDAKQLEAEEPAINRRDK